MYKITYVHKNETEENTLYIPGSREYCLTEARLSVECGKSGELSISIPDANPAKADIECLTDEVIVYRNDKEIWRGRPITMQIDFNLTGNLTCEGILSYLYDTYFEPFEFEGSPKELLQWLLDNHNSKVEERKQFKLGEVTVEDSNDYINRSSIYYNRTLSVMTDKLSGSSLGGMFRARVEDDGRYIDYINAYNTESSQPVRYGYNLLDIAQDIEYGDLATVILPLGARLEDEDGMETDDRLTIESVNDGSIYLVDEASVERYGWIVVEMEWDDVTVASNLLEKAQYALAQQIMPINQFTIEAVDMSLADPELDPINLGDFVLIRMDAMNMNQMVELTGMDINILDPVDSTLQFGTDAATLSGTTSKTQRSIQESMNSMSVRFDNLSTNVLNAVYANIETIVAGIVTADFIRAAVADLGYVTADWVEANTITVQDLEAVYADIESLYADLANIHVLFADYATIEELTAFEAYIANEYVSNAVIADLLAGYAKIVDLDAVYADISELNADMATIAVLLGGVSSIGELTTIHLTADNAIIDEAVIVEALVGTVLADIIQSNVIYTDYITIMSENGGIVLAGTTMQFSDSSGTVRLQLGEDADGNFTFILYDETGTGVMIDSEGIHASAVPDGLIVNDMVAEDANIAANKLDIDDLTKTLNENGQLLLSAEQITIGGGTLDYALTEITQQLEDLESMGIESIVNYYAYGTATTYPPFEWEDDDSAVLGEGILGLMVLGVNGDSNWSIEQPPYKEGEYVWWAQKITYVDGTVVWTEPALWTDDYLRNAITIAQTELEVVQGQIQAKIWMTDIEAAEDNLTATITEQYGILTVLIDTIDERVGVMETTYGDEFTELYSLVTSLTLDLSGIVAQVTEIDEKTANALLYGTPYYAVSTSPNYYPPFEEGADESAVLGEGILGLMILGETGDFQWSTEQPIAGEGEYVWVAYLVTQLDGSTYWTEPMLLTDDWLRRQMSDMSDKYSQLVLTIDSALLEVYAAISTVEGSVTELDASIREYVDETSADILSEVAGLYVTDDEFTSVTASIEQYVDQETASVLIEVSQTLIDYSKIDETVRNVEIYYCVNNNPESIDGTEVNWSKDYPKIEAGQFIWVRNLITYVDGSQEWTEPYCITTDVDLSDYPTMSTMNASIEAYIGDSESYILSQVEGTYATEDSLTQATNYIEQVISETESSITSWVEGTYVTNGEFTQATASIEQYVSEQISSITMSVTGGLGDTAYIYVSAGGEESLAGEIDLSNVREAFAQENSEIDIGAGRVNFYTGTLTVNGDQFVLDENGDAYFSGTLNAPNGNIGGWVIGDKSLYNGTDSMDSFTTGTYIGTDGIRQASRSRVGSYSDGRVVYDYYYLNIDKRVIENGYYEQTESDTGTSTDYYNRVLIQNGSIRFDHNGSAYAYLSLPSNSSTSLRITADEVDLVSSYSVCGGSSRYDYTLTVRGNAISTQGWYVLQGGSYTSLRSDISPLSAKTDSFIDKIEPISYRYESDADQNIDQKLHFGVTIQSLKEALEAEGINPEETAIFATATDENGTQYNAINYGEFIGILLYEVKELREQINSLTTGNA